MTFGLFLLTALAEILGCYAFFVVLRQKRSALWFIPGIVGLGFFAWLLTLHPAASGRVYAAYGGVYIVCALVWLWFVDGIRPSAWDVAGGMLCLLGSGVIYFAPRA